MKGNQKSESRLYDGMVVLGRFTLHERIGSGGQGEVWSAYDNETGDAVAIKAVTDVEERWGRERWERVWNEATSVKDCHFVQVLLFGRSADRTFGFIAMELCEGSLQDCVPSEGLKVGQALKYAHDFTSGLAVLHRREPARVHCDVKPANALLRDDRVKLGDLGLVADAGSRSNGFGTPAYMAPEQFPRAGVVVDPVLSPRTDVFAAGLTILFTLDGKTPVARKKKESARAYVKRARKDLEARLAALKCDPMVVDALRKCTAEQPDERYADGSELKAALEELRDQLRAQLETVGNAPTVTAVPPDQTTELDPDVTVDFGTLQPDVIPSVDRPFEWPMLDKLEKYLLRKCPGVSAEAGHPRLPGPLA